MTLMEGIHVVERGRQLRVPLGEGLGVVHPHSIYNKGKVFPFWLYYTPYPPDKAELPFLAVSNDLLYYHAQGVVNPLLSRGFPGSWDDHHLADIDVVRFRGVWHMYFAGATYRGKKVVSIGVATSTDGVKWTKEEKPVLVPDETIPWEKGDGERVAVEGPTALEVGGSLYLYYSAPGYDGIQRILVAVSNDGISFKKKGIVLEPTYTWEKRGLSHPYVSYIDNKMVMLYVADDGKCMHLGMAYSEEDPAIFKKLTRPIISPSSLCVYHYKNIKHFSINIRRIYKYTIRNVIEKNLLSPFWNKLHIYRSSFLATPEKRVVMQNNTAILYVSSYDLILLVPTIGYYKAKITLP